MMMMCQCLHKDLQVVGRCTMGVPDQVGKCEDANLFLGTCAEPSGHDLFCICQILGTGHNVLEKDTNFLNHLQSNPVMVD